MKIRHKIIKALFAGAIMAMLISFSIEYKAVRDQRNKAVLGDSYKIFKSIENIVGVYTDYQTRQFKVLLSSIDGNESKILARIGSAPSPGNRMVGNELLRAFFYGKNHVYKYIHIYGDDGRMMYAYAGGVEIRPEDFGRLDDSSLNLSEIKEISEDTCVLVGVKSGVVDYTCKFKQTNSSSVDLNGYAKYGLVLGELHDILTRNYYATESVSNSANISSYYSIKTKDGHKAILTNMPVNVAASVVKNDSGYYVNDYNSNILGGSTMEIYLPKHMYSPLINSLIYRILVFVFLMIIVMSVMAVIINKKVVKPITDLAERVGSLKHVGYINQITYGGDDEISNLAGAIEDMRNSILVNQSIISRNASLVAIGSTASQIAHDVRKPLTSLKSLVMLLPEKHDDQEFITDFSKRVEDSIDKTNSMLSEILEFSKDATSLERRNCDPQSIITSSLSDVFTGKTDISVGVAYDLKHKNYLNVDCNRVVRVVTNILGNAVEAMNGKGMLWINTLDADGPMMRIELVNNGPMIPEDVQKRLFDPFFTKGKKGGTGLGLAICQKVIEMHGGKIWVESDMEKTTFIIELPVNPGNLSVNEAELIHHSDELKTFIEEEKMREQYGESENKAEFMRLHKDHGKPFNMLVVDDEPLFRETIRTLLGKITQVRDHVKVYEADSAEMALTLFGERGFDYVIADIDMGSDRMNGYEFVKIVLDRNKGTKVLLHSNKRREDCDQEIRKISNPDFMGFMPKPMKQSELLQLLAMKSFEVRKPAEELKKKNVLVLNDDDALLMSFKVLLRAPDVQVLEATNVSDALRHMEKNKIDIILSDINLGDTKVDGYDFLKEVRKQHKDLPFYMVSGYSESEEGPKAQKEGATGYLQLPVEKEQLVALLN